MIIFRADMYILREDGNTIYTHTHVNIHMAKDRSKWNTAVSFHWVGKYVIIALQASMVVFQLVQELIKNNM